MSRYCILFSTYDAKKIKQFLNLKFIFDLKYVAEQSEDGCPVCETCSISDGQILTIREKAHKFLVDDQKTSAKSDEKFIDIPVKDTNITVNLTKKIQT